MPDEGKIIVLAASLAIARPRSAGEESQLPLRLACKAMRRGNAVGMSFPLRIGLEEDTDSKV